MSVRTPTELAEHRAAHDWCTDCDAQRPYGECTSCGGWTEAVGPDELGICCGSKVALTPRDRSAAEVARLAVEEARERSWALIERENAWSN